MSQEQESGANRQARQVAERLEALLPEVGQAIAYADDKNAARVLDAALRLAAAAKSMDQAKGPLGD